MYQVQFEFDNSCVWINWYLTISDWKIDLQIESSRVTGDSADKLQPFGGISKVNN